MSVCVKCGSEKFSGKNCRVCAAKKYDKKTWQIDHIISQSKLPYTSMSDDNFNKCWALENLQPLEAIANIKKSNK